MKFGTLSENDDFNIRVERGDLLSVALREEIVSLCNRAYGEDMGALLNTFADAAHVLGYWEGTLVSHALCVTRSLQAGEGISLRTAYVEAVATAPAFQRRGFAAAVMQHLVKQVQGYDLAALSPFSVAYYTRLGWELWRGALFIRTGHDRLPSPPEERVMVYRLPGTPPLELDAPLSAEWRAGELW